MFLLDRGFLPPNERMRKMLDRFLDKPDPLVSVIAARFSVDATALVSVRVVSHHMRLLGVLVERGATSRLVLVNDDDVKGD